MALQRAWPPLYAAADGRRNTPDLSDRRVPGNGDNGRFPHPARPRGYSYLPPERPSAAHNRLLHVDSPRSHVHRTCLLARWSSAKMPEAYAQGLSGAMG